MKTGALRFIAVVLAVLVPWPAWPGNRPRVGVRFDVQVPTYQQAITRMAGFTADAERAIAATLGARERFIDFVPGSSEPVMLRVSLVPSDLSAKALEDGTVSLRLTLTRSQSDSVSTFWPFREYTVHINTEELVRELKFVFEQRDRIDLEGPLLSKVPIADSCLTRVGTSVNWVIPHTRADLCAGSGTRFTLKAILVEDDGRWEPNLEALADAVVHESSTLPTRYHGRMLAKAMNLTTEDLARIRARPDSLHVVAVYITAYDPLIDCELEDQP